MEGATIAVPNDTTNEARALLLLQDNGYITLREGAGLNATVNDIVENPYNIEIVELEAAQIPRTLQEVSFGVLNGNYAMQAGMTVANDALLFESDESEAAATYVNVVAVKEGNEDSEKIKALVDVLKSDAIKQYINLQCAECDRCIYRWIIRRFRIYIHFRIRGISNSCDTICIDCNCFIIIVRVDI